MIEGSCFAASIARATDRAGYEMMRGEILPPPDGVLLGLHGAMVEHGYDDTEGDLIERVRILIGRKCVIGVEFDPHCHLPLKRAHHAGIIVLYKDLPHADVVPRTC